MTAEQRFMELFWGREDRLGMNIDGKEQSVEMDKSGLMTVTDFMSNHLQYPSEPIVGVYPVRPDELCRWGCFDFDSKTSNPAADAERCRQALERAGLHGHIEISRSGDGRHVWVFSEEWIDWEVMKLALMFIDHAAELDCNEINPKQRLGTDFTKNLGNYVRLPYHAGHDTMKMIDHETGEILDLEQAMASIKTCSLAQLNFVASRYVKQAPPRRKVGLAMNSQERASSQTPTQDAQLILRGEMIEHEGGFVDGRDNKLWNLAIYLAGHPRYEQEEAEHVMAGVYQNQLSQEPDHIPLSVCLDKIRRAFEQKDDDES